MTMNPPPPPNVMTPPEAGCCRQHTCRTCLDQIAAPGYQKQDQAAVLSFLGGLAASSSVIAGILCSTQILPLGGILPAALGLAAQPGPLNRPGKSAPKPARNSARRAPPRCPRPAVSKTENAGSRHNEKHPTN